MEPGWYSGLYVVALAISLWICLRCLLRNRLWHIPGPRGLPFLGNALHIDSKRINLTLHRWSITYGGLYRIRLPVGDILIASGYSTIHHLLNGNTFAGRVNIGRNKYMGISDAVVSLQPGDTLRHIRKLSHRYMKQFGDGMSRLEAILLQNANYMLETLDSQTEKPINTLDILRDTALRSISVLLLGEGVDTGHGQDIYNKLLKYEKEIFRVSERSLGNLLLDICPWLIHVPLPTSVDYWKFNTLQDECWNRVLETQTEGGVESLTQVLLKSAVTATSATENRRENLLAVEEKHAKMSSLVLILAGVSTTSRALHFILNMMAFRQDIQQKVYSEISTVLADGGISRVTIAQRAKMPYLRATILECLRAFTVTPSGGMPHSPVVDAEVPGYGVIPKGTCILINTWTLHHDDSLWEEPHIVLPERFLDAEGELVPPDHPNRKHLLPFGAGPRVCLGEVFAMTRLFLWTAAVIQNFAITPAPDSDCEWLNPDVHLNMSAMLDPLPNNVILSSRP